MASLDEIKAYFDPKFEQIQSNYEEIKIILQNHRENMFELSESVELILTMKEEGTRYRYLENELVSESLRPEGQFLKFLTLWVAFCPTANKL